MYFDAEVIQHMNIMNKEPMDQILAKLQSGNHELHQIYKNCVENRKNFMKTVYPSVIHSAVSSPKNSVGGMSGGTNLYISPDDNSSNPRGSIKDLNVKSNALDNSGNIQIQRHQYFKNQIKDQILSPKQNVRTHGKFVDSKVCSFCKKDVQQLF